MKGVSETMAENLSLSQQLAQYACSLTYENLSWDQVQKVKTHFLDWLGTVYAGRTQTPIQIILEVIGNLGGQPESTIIPTNGKKTMCLLAAWVNSASCCLLEMDDLHRESIFHPASVVIPAVLALAEREHASGREIIAAIAAGYEVGIRVALGVGISHYRFWHPTATCGTFAAAAGAAKIIGLDAEKFTWALGSAGTQAAGLWEFLVESAMSKPLHIGKAAMNGLLAALMAQKGLTGARKILEGEKGFFHATSQDYREDKCLEGLGQKFLFEQTSLKYYASCGHTHSTIDAVLRATGAKPVSAKEIERVNVYIYQAALDLLGKVEPTTPTQAKFHLPFCVATALLYGGVESKDFNLAQLTNPKIYELMPRVRLYSDSELTRNYPCKWISRVEIITRAGQRLEGICELPKGDPANPLTEGEVIQKFKILSKNALSSKAVERILERVMNLEQVDDVVNLLNV